MFYIKSFVEFATTPSNLFFLLLAIALVSMVLHRTRIALTSLGFGLIGCVAFGFTSLSELMIAPLVTRFPPVDLQTAPAPDGLIILGGGLHEAHAAHNGALMELGEGGEAMPTAALLAQRYPEARIILSGGNGGAFPASPLRVVDGMARVMTEFGISPERLILEPNSNTTSDRIANTLHLIGEDRDKVWWVITPAHRMPRVIGLYRKAGFEPVPYPIDFKWIPPFDPSYRYGLLEGLSLTDTGAHEWRGLATYYFSGKIDTLFPGPAPLKLALSPDA